MIVRERPRGLMLFLVMRGSVIPRIGGTLALATALAVVVTLLHHQAFALPIAVSPLPFTLLGLPLAIFLAFRNNTAYDRFWEARKQWGEIVYRTRSLARQCTGLVAGTQPLAAEDEGDARVRMVRSAVAFTHALRLSLRGLRDDALLQRWVPAVVWPQVARSGNAADALLRTMGRDLGDAVRAGHIEPCLAAQVDVTLTGLAGCAAACERIRHTPMPFSYTLLLHRTAYMYCFLLPFGLVESLGVVTPFVVAVVAYTFFGLDALGDEIEEPFGFENNDLPLDALCRTIEINLLEALGATDLPAPLQPQDFQLT